MHSQKFGMGPIYAGAASAESPKPDRAKFPARRPGLSPLLSPVSPDRISRLTLHLRIRAGIGSGKGGGESPKIDGRGERRCMLQVACCRLQVATVDSSTHALRHSCAP